MTNSNSGIRWTFWVIVILALIWHVLGALNFIMQMNVDSLASMPETHRAIIVDRPIWATAGFALAVFAGALGCVLLLARKSQAKYLFLLSLLGVLVQLIHTLKIAGSSVQFGTMEGFMMIASPVLVVLLLLWFTHRAHKRGWLT